MWTPRWLFASWPLVAMSSAVAIGAPLQHEPATAAIRCLSPAAAQALDAGNQLSATFRRLVRRLQISDVIVYVESGTCDFDRLQACTKHWLGHMGEYRVVRITVNTRRRSPALIASLAHELQHALEIAEHEDVVDASSMTALFRRIGFACADHAENCYETWGAIETTRNVMKELGRRSSAAEPGQPHD